MPRREVVTPVQRSRLFAFPEDESEPGRPATLSAEDFAFVRQHRGGHNRLGIAVLLIYLRFPGRVLI
jgi:TnpA family transposase